MDRQTISKPYLVSTFFLIFVLPVTVVFWEVFSQNHVFNLTLVGKWFVFSAAGLRLFVAGIKQAADPGFTATEIFNVQGSSSFPVVRELGFANICFGALGVISLFLADWRLPAAFCCGLYYGFAALLHIIKKPVSPNETFALITDVFVFLVLLLYFTTSI